MLILHYVNLLTNIDCWSLSTTESAENTAMAISKVISIQEMTSFIQSAIIYDQISSDNTVFAFYNLYNSLPIKIASLCISLFQGWQMT